MTKISFRRTGGIAGREITSNMDLNELPNSESRALMHLIIESDFFKIPQNLIYTLTPDEYEYTVTVDAGNVHHTIHVSDATVPASLRPLLDRLSALARDGKSDPLK